MIVVAVYDRRMSGPGTNVAVFVLAGGKSSRMGEDKAFVRLGGRTLLEQALETARGVADDVRIVGEPLKFAQFAPVVEDVFPASGPLGGIHAALRASRAELNLMLAVDMPFVSPKLLEFLIKRAESMSAAVTVPRVNGGWQPLCAVYRPEFADAAEKALRAGHYRIDALFDSVPVQAVSEEELKAAGFSSEMFRNLNTREELVEARGVHTAAG